MSICSCRSRLIPSRNCQVFRLLWRGGFFSRKEPTVPEEELENKDPTARRKIVQGEDGHLTSHQLNLLKAKQSLTTQRGYKPQKNVEKRIKHIMQFAVEDADNWEDISLKDARLKYKILTQFIKEFDHDIPNALMSDMNTVKDAVNYFQTEIRETSALEDLAKLDLPPNLHIQLEPTRFNPETDTLYGGRTAFPGSDTHVTSIKYRRKYESVKTTKEKPGYANHYYGY